MSRRRGIFRATRIRRAVQLLVLLLFLGSVVSTRPGSSDGPNHLVELFFHLDPLILVTTWLTTHALVQGAALALAVIVVTLLVGRVFCGWVCPFGTIHDIAGRFLDGWRRNPKRRDHWSPWQRGKYYLLVGLLVMAALGSHWVTIMDPLVLLYRTTATALLPGVQWAVEEGYTTVYQADAQRALESADDEEAGGRSGPSLMVRLADPVYEFFRDHVFAVPDQAFLGAGLIAVVFVVLVALNAYRRRFWCRYLCPLGALLGLLSWRPLLRRAVREENCNQCDLCGSACHGAAASEPGQGWKPAECLGCLNCTDSCNRDGLGFRLAWPWRRQPAVEGVDLSKRAALASAAGGLVALALMRANPQSRGLTTGEPRFNPNLIRPPGARPEREFLQRCTGCGLCMKVCPTGALQPSLVEAGFEGLWTPRLVARLGYCDYDCTLCGQVCPTQAIERLIPEEKHLVKIGLARFDTSRCLPYAYGRNCMVCEEHCPVPDKAIYYLEVEVTDRNGQAHSIKQPHVDPDLCVGCGVCVGVCVLKDQPAIRVFSTNETRNRGHDFIQPADPWDSLY